MPSSYDKLWFQDSLLRNAVNRAREQIKHTGRALPCKVTAVNGAIVTVAFEVQTSATLPKITVPKAESNWIRMPTQVGDAGMLIPADTYLEPVAGMSQGTAQMGVRPGNLSGLLFVPVSNQQSAPADQNAAQVQGPNGVILQTTEGTTSKVTTDQSGTIIKFGDATITVSSGQIQLSAGGTTLTISSSGTTIDGSQCSIDGIVFDTHKHGGVQSGGSTTLGPQS